MVAWWWLLVVMWISGAAGYFIAALMAVGARGEIDCTPRGNGQVILTRPPSGKKVGK